MKRLVVKENCSLDSVCLDDQDIRYLQDFHTHFSHVTPDNVRVSLGKETSTFSIHTENIVGFIELPSGTRLLIRPKVSLPNLLYMLSTVSDLYRPDRKRIEFSESDDDIVELLARLFVDEIKGIFKLGLNKTYNRVNRVMPFVKGRVLISDYANNAIVKPLEIPCSFDSRSFNSNENQVLLACIKKLLKVGVRHEETRNQLRRFLKAFPGEIDFIENPLGLLSRIDIGRQNKRYEQGLGLAKVILSGMNFRDNEGNQSLPAFVINTAVLFEKYVERVLDRVLEPTSLRAEYQRGYELAKVDDSTKVSMNPDVLFLGSDGGILLIGDMKYKDFDKKQLRASDTHQMISYMTKLGCPQAVLIYPSFESSGHTLANANIQTETHGPLAIKLCPLPLEPSEAQSRIIHQLLREFIEPEEKQVS